MECTENYGKLDEKELEKGLHGRYGRFFNNNKQLLLDRIAKYNRYIINIISIETRNSESFGGRAGNMIINDNYGDYIEMTYRYDRQDGLLIYFRSDYPSDFDEYGKRTKYILPNIYIDIIKTITSDTDINIFININKAVEKYYNNFIKYDILYNSGKLQEYNKLLEKNDEKDKKIEELNNDILSKNQQIESMNNDILSKNQLIESMKINIIFYPGSSRSDDPV
jgi:hypothetical protein